VLKGGALQRRLLYLLFSQNTQWRVLLNKIVLLFLHWFFIGYWILKTGLDVYPGPFYFVVK
jgi:hypothetical protein